MQPLGVNGDLSYYLDRLSQLRSVKKHEAQAIMHLFGDRIELLCRNFPQFGKDGDRKVNRFDQTTAAMTMIAACAEKGLFNPDGSVRGVGAWADDDGQLIYHCGQKLLTAEGVKAPAEHGGKIYPAYPPIPEPATVAVRGDVAEDILRTYGTWNWTRPDVDPMIALGMTGVQMLCGALGWRPVFWITGDKSTGKSAFQDMIRHLHGTTGIVQTNDPTKSGITARLGHSSLPVAVDELEPGDEGSSRERDIIVLARVAASGGQWLRGTADQKGASGNVYSAFMFSSILIPGVMGSQDRSRLITLGLNPFLPDAPKPVISARVWGPKGAALKRILIDRWPTWAERLELWRVALAEAGLNNRNGDNWATTIAMADMALNAALPDRAELQQWARKLAFAAAAEIDDIGSNAEDMLTHLLGQPFDVFRRGELWLVAHWIMTAAALPGAPRELILGSADAGGMPTAIERMEGAKRANEKLAKIGLRVKGEGEAAQLFIPNSKLPGLLKLFEGSTWAKGVWKQAAHRIPGAEPVKHALTLAGQSSKGVYVPIKNIGGLLYFPMDRPAPATPPPAPNPQNEFGDDFY